MHFSQKTIRAMATFWLGLIDPKIQPYGLSLWTKLARLTIPVAIEIVVLRPGSHGTEVLLAQRAPNEPAYPNEWHVPGSIMRPGETIEDVIKRLEEREFKAKIISQKFVTNFNNLHEQRGHFFSVVYLCEVETHSLGTWYQIDHLPEPTIRHHRDHLIPMAVKTFNGSGFPPAWE